MHIKQITISNFRSFRQQPEIQPFTAGMNGVVGRNGSGKSNLFDAVQFCLLAPRFVNLRQEERQALLHEGSGSAAVNAFVEIVFDNSDQRLTIDTSDEVVLRRTIGLKKDEFFLQRQRTTKQEVQSLLEGAGFSKSNPYYIVQQGKVQDLCTMSEGARLRLLMEVAGTTVYDQKKAESNAKMQENRVDIAKIAEILTDIQTRLAELQTEKEELTAYQGLDRQRRALEYSLYDKEWQKARQLLEKLEEERADHTQRLTDLDDEAKTLHDQIRNVEARVQERATARSRNARHLTNHQDDLRANHQKMAQAALACQELREALAAEMAEQESTAQQLETLAAEITQTEAQLTQQVEPAWNQAVEALENSKTEVATADQKIRGLYAKQGRGRHFSSVEARDAFLQGRIDEMETQKQDQTQTMQQEQDRLAHLRRSMQDMKNEKDAAAGQLQKHSNDHAGLTKTLDEKKRTHVECLEERKAILRQRDVLQDQVREARETVARTKGDLRKTTPRATSFGLDALQTIVEQEGLRHGEQYFGPLLNNFTLRDAKYQTAVEVAAQNALFHVIVDTDETASRLMRRLEEGKMGRVTFLPMSQLRIDANSQLPTNNADVRPLLEHCLEFDPTVERALRHVFGKKLLCRNLDLATEWSSRLGVDGITLDGDLCSRKGSMTGGYLDSSRSRLAAFEAFRTASAKLSELEGQNREIEQQSKKIDQKVSSIMQEVQRLGAKHAQLGNLLAQKEAAVERFEESQLQTTKSIEQVEKTTLPPLQRDLATLEKEIERLKEEIGTELVETLSGDERQLLEQLKEGKAQLEKDIAAQTEAASKLGLERQKLQSILHDNLYKRRRELMEGTKGTRGGDGSGGRTSFSASIAQKKEELDETERELDELKRLKDQIQSRYDQAREADEKLQEEEAKARNDLDQLRNDDLKYAKLFEEAQEMSERLLNKRSMYISKRETYMRKIQELGSLPPPAELEKFANKSISELMKTLDHVNKKLKSYSHVNKKAFDQYVNFNEQREQLLKRKDELDEGASKVEELIDNLDRQKDEAINRTFRDVSRHFKDVFKELVPAGEGELIMKTAMDEEMHMGEEEEPDSPEKAGRDPDVSMYKGIGIKVRFSAYGETYMMSQLSGGQKALVALTLIFSIQRCDPAPFYLFDELDQALDSTYRSAVADLIKKQADSKEHPTQFIVSTFRPELVDRSERWFGISHQNKVSSLHGLSKKDALHFIANLMNEEEAVGEVTTVQSSKATSRRSSTSRKRKTIAGTASSAADNEGDGDEGEGVSSKVRAAGRLSAPA